MSRALGASAGRVGACRAGGAATVKVQFHFAFGEVSMAAPAPDNAGPRDVASCVARAIAPAFPTFGDDTNGIVFVQVSL